MRLTRDFAELSQDQVRQVRTDIDASLTGFFRRGGLTLATLIFAPPNGHGRPAPPSIVRFISDASTTYDDPLLRQAFVHTAISSFTSATEAERQYLGRLSQGFFAFHALGAFGEVAVERLQDARSTVWLVDSNIQIPALALGAPTNGAIAGVFARLRDAGIAMVSTAKVFDETAEHLGFAASVIRQHGADSYLVAAAANGESPYRSQNQFLQGFLRWRVERGSDDWGHYLFEALGFRSPSLAELETAARGLGLRVIELQDWPGFTAGDFDHQEGLTEALKAFMKTRGIGNPDGDYDAWLDRKVRPEAEASLVVTKERSGDYHLWSRAGESSSAWFISSTSAINVVVEGPKVTWQPEAFLDFASTLLTEIDPTSADRAFEVLLWQLAQSGASPVSEGEIEAVFGGVIDQATLALTEQRQAYRETISDRYGENPEAVIARMRPSQRVLAALQLTNEIVERQAQDLQLVRTQTVEVTRRANAAETALGKVERYRRKVANREAVNKKRIRQANARGKKRK